MWFRLQSCETLVNQDNIIKIFVEPLPKGTIGIFALLSNNERIILGSFNTSIQAKSFINSVQDHINKDVPVIDVQPLVSLALLNV